MTKEEKLKRIRRIREQSRHTVQKRVLQYKPANEKIRKTLKHGWSEIKNIAKNTLLVGTVALASIAGVLSERTDAAPTPVKRPNQITQLTENSSSITKNISDQAPEAALSPQDIDSLVAADVQRIQNDINACIDQTQTEIRSAKRHGQRNRAVKRLFDAVCPGINISGSANYCVAGALYVHQQCHDETMNELLPTVRDISPQTGNPTTSCVALSKYYEQNLNHRYARKGNANFKKAYQNIKKGDILLVFSNGNTASGLHCVTAAESPSNGRVKIQSFNSESTYYAQSSDIAVIINIVDEYTDRRTQHYTQQMLLAQSQSQQSENLPNLAILASGGDIAEPMPAVLTTQDPRSAIRNAAQEPLPASLRQRGGNCR